MTVPASKPELKRAVRVLHAPTEISGQVGQAVLGLRELGCMAYAAFPDHRFAYGIKADFPIASGNKWYRFVDRLLKSLRTLNAYDIFHYHAGQSLLPERLRYSDAVLNVLLQKRVVIEAWGTDVRVPTIESQRNPFFLNTYNKGDAEVMLRMERWSAITQGHVIVPDHSFDAYVGKWFEHIHIGGFRVDTRRIKPHYPSPEQEKPLLVHIPSHMGIKGTELIREAAECLKAKGLNFDYVELHDVTHPAAMALTAKADLVIDQLRIGSHGVYAVESMALGKPVLCYILPELVPTFPAGFPIINANPHSLVEVLEEWLQKPEERYQLGIASREYAERVHDTRVVAARLMKIYQALPPMPTEPPRHAHP